MMKYNVWVGVSLFGLLSCHEQPKQDEPATAPAAEPVSVPSAAAPAVVPASAPASLAVTGVGSCQASPQVDTMARRAMDLFDADGNGKLSRNEATSAANFLIGGFFFRADQNGDGTITPEEGRQERAELAQRYPAAASLLLQAKQAAGTTRAFSSLAQILDSAYDKSLKLLDARAAAGTAVDDAFRLADTNNNKEIDGAELAEVSLKGARSLGHATFASADTNGDQFLSADEFQKAINASTQPVFQMTDLNHDGRLSETEASSAIGAVAQRLGMAGGG